MPPEETISEEEMPFIAEVIKGGRLTIPEEIRKLLRIEEGNYVLIRLKVVSRKRLGKKAKAMSAWRERRNLRESGRMSSTAQPPEHKFLPATVVTPKVRSTREVPLPSATRRYSSFQEEPVRLCGWASYEPYPLFMKAGAGSKVVDVDDNTYIDYLLAFGALVNGHAHPKIVEAVQKQAQEGMMFGTPVELEIDLAKKFKQFVPSADMVVFANGGMDATSDAVRIARAATGKDLVLKFEGHYHGQHDYAMVSVEAPPVVAGMEEYPRSLRIRPEYLAGLGHCGRGTLEQRQGTRTHHEETQE